MTIQQAIQLDLVAAIVEHCKISSERAAKELRIAKAAAKMTGLTLAETLKHAGLVA